jgi:hypothetical protein
MALRAVELVKLACSRPRGARIVEWYSEGTLRGGEKDLVRNGQPVYLEKAG